MLALDAMEGDAPTWLLVLGTRTATIDMQRFYLGSQAVARALRTYTGKPKYTRGARPLWPDFEYASVLEFTTGYGERSGGLRRPHWNWLVKGIPTEDGELAGRIAAEAWCEHVDAELQAQDSRRIYAAGGLMRYLALHFQKASQQPPEGFTGQRFNCSVGYFTGCTRAQARARARDSLGLKRCVWRLAQVHDDAHDVELLAQLAHRRNLATRWVVASETGAQISGGILRPWTLDTNGNVAEGDMGARLRTLRQRERDGRPSDGTDGGWMPASEALFLVGFDDRYA